VSHLFTRKEIRAYFDVPLILGNVRHALLMLFSVYLFLSQGCASICGRVSFYFSPPDFYAGVSLI
jgi:hypothetical protein